jgi:hypothetical protein
MTKNEEFPLFTRASVLISAVQDFQLLLMLKIKEFFFSVCYNSSVSATVSMAATYFKVEKYL